MYLKYHVLDKKPSLVRVNVKVVTSSLRAKRGNLIVSRRHSGPRAGIQVLISQDCHGSQQVASLAMTAIINHMLQANLQQPETYQSQLTGPIWEKVLTWLKTIPKGIALGEQEIQGREIYANVQEGETVPRDKAVFEAHKKYIDLHFCIKGGELIEYAPAEKLEPTTQYDVEKDYALYNSPATAASVKLTPNSFVIFFPEEAHMPKINDGRNVKIKKVVVKIAADLLTSFRT